MIQLMIKDFMGVGGIITTCPYCEVDQVLSPSCLCSTCWQMLPPPEDLLHNVEDRFHFFEGPEPWDY